MENYKNILPQVTVSSCNVKKYKSFDNHMDDSKLINEEIKFKDDDIVILVGANNCGKSRFLKDIQAKLLDTDDNYQHLTYSEISISSKNFDRDILHKYYRNYYYKNEFGNYVVQVGNNNYQFNDNNFSDAYDDRYFYKCFYSYLSTENRLQLSKPVMNGDISENQAFNLLKNLDKSKDILIKLNKYLSVMFEKSVDISQEYTENSLKKVFKVGNSADIEYALNLDKWSNEKTIGNYENLFEQGDGLRSAFAILASLISSPHHLFLIDEPESFLHPPQAHALGKSIVSLSEGKQCFIATHNIDFIKGVIESGSERVKIFKIDRKENDNVFSEIDQTSISAIANDRNLRFSNLLNCLFYEKIGLCEDESDCKFYANILESLDEELSEKVLFCGVGGKDQFKKVIPILKKLHVDYSVISDIDMINDNTKINDLLKSIDSDGLEPILNDFKQFTELWNNKLEKKQIKIEEIRESLNKILDDISGEYLSSDDEKKISNLVKGNKKFDLIKKGGRAALPEECKDKFDKILEYLKTKNIYVLPYGELEALVKIDGCNYHGDKWVNYVFEVYDDLNDNVYNNAKEFVSSIFKNEINKPVLSKDELSVDAEVSDDAN